jgi:hypothetical protein
LGDTRRLVEIQTPSVGWVTTEFPDAEEHTLAILTTVKGDYKLALERIPVLGLFGFSEQYCRRIAELLTPKEER